MMQLFHAENFHFFVLDQERKKSISSKCAINFALL
jgi:hypothetical protein